MQNAPVTVHNRIGMSARAGILLEELRAMYRRLGHEERQQIKILVLTLSKSNGDLVFGKESTHRIRVRNGRV